MAIPWAGYIAEETWESGAADTAVWNGTPVDTQAKANVRHYSYLVTHQRAEVPYRGAYAYEVDLSLGTADAYVESTLWATALAGTIWTRFYVFASGLTMASGDKFSLLEVQSAGAVTEAMVGIKNTGTDIQIYAGETQASATVRACSLIQGAWHLVEIATTVDSGGGNDGTVALYVDGYQIGATITSLDQAAFTQARLGAMGIDAGTTTGVLLFDQVVASPGRTGGLRQRWPQTVTLSKSGHAAVGNGSYEDMYLEPGGALDNHLIAYDTDEANVLEALANISPDLTQSDHKYYIASKRDGNFHRGLYVQLTGTNPRAYVVLRDALVTKGAIASYVQRRQAHQAF